MSAKRNPPPPKWFDEIAKIKWKEMWKNETIANEIKPMDTPLLEAYCNSYSKWVQAEEMLQKVNPIQVFESGARQQSPEVGIANKAMEYMIKCLDKLNLNPSTRKRISSKNNMSDEEQIDDEMEGIISQ